MTKLNPRLPTGDLNGLADRASAYVRNPQAKRVLLVVADTQKVIRDVGTGDEEPQLRILAVEELTKEDSPTGEVLMRRARDRRNGGTVLEFETEDEITRLFAELSGHDEEGKA